MRSARFVSSDQMTWQPVLPGASSRTETQSFQEPTQYGVASCCGKQNTHENASAPKLRRGGERRGSHWAAFEGSPTLIQAEKPKPLDALTWSSMPQADQPTPTPIPMLDLGRQ